MRIRLLVVLLVAAGMLAAAVPAAANDVVWQQYDVTVEIREDGTAHVTETMDVRFGGAFSQGNATIPMNRIERIENVAVAEAIAGGPLAPTTFQAAEVDGDFVIDYDLERTSAGEVRTIVLEYDVVGVIRVYPDNDPPRQEIRWTAISDEVTAIGPVREASATIIFPASVEGSAATRFDPEPDTSTATSVTWTKRGMGEGASLKTFASFPAMTEATKPAWQDKADTLESRRERVPALAIVAGLVGAVGFGLVGLFAWRDGRDPEVGAVADILAEPPGDLPAPLVGTLTDESFDQRDMLAMLMELNRRGIMDITEDGRARARDNDPTRFHLTLLEPIESTPAWAHPMLEGLFGQNAPVGKSTTFERLKRLGSSSMSNMSRAVERELLERGYYAESPTKTRIRWGVRVLGVAVLMGLLFLGIVAWAEEIGGWVIAAGVFSALMAFGGGILAMNSVKKSPSGAEEAAKWKAFGRYLKQMQNEMDRRERLQLIDTYLPWAIALGYDETRWKRMMDEEPDYAWGSYQYRPWLRHGVDRASDRVPVPGSRPSGGIDVQSMSNRSMAGIQAANFSMFAMLNTASKTFASGRSSSSGSGSGSASSGSSGGGSRSFS